MALAHKVTKQAIHNRKIMVRSIQKYLSLISGIFICAWILLLSSCNNEEPNTYPIAEDTYVITFTGDCDKFKGIITASTTSEGCLLSSSSFKDQSYNSFSDSQFKDTYELKLSYPDNGKHKTVLIHCSALCFSDERLSMECVIYKLATDGTVLIKDDMKFQSYLKSSHPSSDMYSYTIEL